LELLSYDSVLNLNLFVDYDELIKLKSFGCLVGKRVLPMILLTPRSMERILRDAVKEITPVSSILIVPLKLSHLFHAIVEQIKTARSPPSPVAVVFSTQEKEQMSALPSPQSTVAEHVPSPPSELVVSPSQQRSVESSFAQQNSFEKILVVDDIVVNQKILQSQLMRLGYSRDIIAVVDNGQKGLEYVQDFAQQKLARQIEQGPSTQQKQTPTKGLVMLLDLLMPVLNGVECAKGIRGSTLVPPTLQPWIVGVSAHLQCEDIEECLAAGMNTVLCKPLTTEMLKKVLSEAFVEKK